MIILGEFYDLCDLGLRWRETILMSCNRISGIHCQGAYMESSPRSSFCYLILFSLILLFLGATLLYMLSFHVYYFFTSIEFLECKD